MYTYTRNTSLLIERNDGVPSIRAITTATITNQYEEKEKKNAQN